jgi:hypothetical protein
LKPVERESSSREIFTELVASENAKQLQEQKREHDLKWPNIEWERNAIVSLKFIQLIAVFGPIKNALIWFLVVPDSLVILIVITFEIWIIRVVLAVIRETVWIILTLQSSLSQEGSIAIPNLGYGPQRFVSEVRW